MERRSRILLSFALAAMFALSAAAQTKKEKKDEAAARNLQGTVTDADDKPVVGAVVQLKDMRTLQVRSFITQDGGSYHFSGLKADTDYQVKADYNGVSSGSRTLSVFDDRKTPIVNLKLEKK
jgi:hypothetical protein